MGLTMKEKQMVTREDKTRYQKATKKEKAAVLDEFTRLTGYHWKSAVKMLHVKPAREVLVAVDRKLVKLKPEKKRPANSAGKRVYTDEVIAACALSGRFSGISTGRYSPPPLMRQQMSYIAQWPAFHITGETAEKLKKISPTTIDRYLKKKSGPKNCTGAMAWEWSVAK
ncbi:MAG: hypothetical protein LBD74_02060 [Spirochaetaceae bacterium]|jgi:hypothetical protein|nr:hypothetical protein [Spirochaetaceae bacterium]